MESRRRLLMGNPHSWGALPPSINDKQMSSARSPEPVPEKPRTQPLSPVIPACLSLPSPPSSSPRDPLASMSSDDSDDSLGLPGPALTTKGWTLDGLIAGGARFRHVHRIDATMPVAELNAKIEEFEEKGLPLAIEGWQGHQKWPKELFNLDWLSEYGESELNVRNVHTRKDRKMSLSDFLARTERMLPFAEAGESQRLYGKDYHCPLAWSEWLDKAGVLPETLLPNGPSNVLQHLSSNSPIETLMCYLGVGDTFTPCHKDLCASSGQNVMCYTENGGSSFWFMTASSAAPDVADYFHTLGHELDHEEHVITVEELAAAPFEVYIAEQKLGDMIYVPPRSCHQVVNYGGITVKTSWSRMTVKGLVTALYHELPIYQRVCRPETYRVKSTLHHTLLRYAAELEQLEQLAHDPRGNTRLGPSPFPTAESRFPTSLGRPPPLFDHGDQPQQEGLHALSIPPRLRPNDVIRRQRLLKDLETLLPAFADMLSEEYSHRHNFVTHIDTELRGGRVRHTCDFCDADIWQSFFHCDECVPNGDDAERKFGDGVIICALCYVEGRSCKCGSMVPGQNRPFDDLLREHNEVVQLLGRHGVVAQEIHDNDFAFHDRLFVFEAGCVLLDSRMKEQKEADEGKKFLRQCSQKSASGISHTVHNADSLHCKGCHAARCFRHILDMGVHAAEAILLHAKDANQDLWHRRHWAARKALADNQVGLRAAERSGVHSKLEYRLVMAVVRFRSYKPARDFVKAGWYDGGEKFSLETVFGRGSSDPPLRLSKRTLNPSTLTMPSFRAPQTGDTRESNNPRTPLFLPSPPSSMASPSMGDALRRSGTAEVNPLAKHSDDDSPMQGVEVQSAVNPHPRFPRNRAYVEVPRIKDVLRRQRLENERRRQERDRQRKEADKVRPENAALGGPQRKKARIQLPKDDSTSDEDAPTLIRGPPALRRKVVKLNSRPAPSSGSGTARRTGELANTSTYGSSFSSGSRKLAGLSFKRKRSNEDESIADTTPVLAPSTASASQALPRRGPPVGAPRRRQSPERHAARTTVSRSQQLTAEAADAEGGLGSPFALASDSGPSHPEKSTASLSGRGPLLAQPARPDISPDPSDSLGGQAGLTENSTSEALRHEVVSLRRDFAVFQRTQAETQSLVDRLQRENRDLHTELSDARQRLGDTEGPIHRTVTALTERLNRRSTEERDAIRKLLLKNDDLEQTMADISSRADDDRKRLRALEAALSVSAQGGGEYISSREEGPSRSHRGREGAREVFPGEAESESSRQRALSYSDRSRPRHVDQEMDAPRDLNARPSTSAYASGSEWQPRASTNADSRLRGDSLSYRYPDGKREDEPRYGEPELRRRDERRPPEYPYDRRASEAGPSNHRPQAVDYEGAHSSHPRAPTPDGRVDEDDGRRERRAPTHTAASLDAAGSERGRTPRELSRLSPRHAPPSEWEQDRRPHRSSWNSEDASSWKRL